MANLQQGVPQLQSAMVDNSGTVTQPWYRFFISLYNRTGGSTGTGFAPGDGTYVVASAEDGLDNANVATNTNTVTWDFSHTNQAKANVVLSSIEIPESQVVNLVADLAARVLKTQQVIAGSGLDGGGPLSANVTINLDASAATLLLSIFTSTNQGVVPLSGGGTANFLRADGTWHTPLTGISGTVTLAKITTGGTNGSITYVNGLITAVTAPT